MLECAKVVQVKNLRSVYRNIPGGLYPQPVQVVDIVAQSNNNDVINLTEIPANVDTTDDVKTGLLVSASKDEMNAEILTMKQKSEEVLRSVEYHQRFLSTCDQMLAALNPEFGISQQREQEISSLRAQMEVMSKKNEQMERQLSDFMAFMKEQLGVPTSSDVKQDKYNKL